jgi:hypothetical protein
VTTVLRLLHQSLRYIGRMSQQLGSGALSRQRSRPGCCAKAP